jgi:(1->4)-alpha-D-glucan 1-alpha-D-glucosylmutase
VLGALRPLAERLAMRGVCNSLAQTVLKLTAPGVPDTYQGAEDWKFDLVDPDNRRPVPFDGLAARLRALDEARARADFGPADVGRWLAAWPDGQIKLHVASALLRARRTHPDLWLHGDYRPLNVELAVDATAMAFARSHAQGGFALVITGLRTARLPGTWPVGASWATSRLLLPDDSPDGAWRDLLSGAVLSPVRTSSERWLFLAQALHVMPVAVLVPDAS